MTQFPLVVLKVFLVTITVLIFAVSVLVWGPSAESQYYPVQREWSPMSVKIDGAALLVTGTVIKSRGCEYVPPPRARDANGKHYPVISLSPTANQSWRPLGTPQQFGPWRVVGGKGVGLEFYQEHRCHDLWPTFSILGKISAP